MAAGGDLLKLLREANLSQRAIYCVNLREPAAEPKGDEHIPERDCAHYWVIDSPSGPTSWGRCVRCSAKREFRNSGDHWEDGGLAHPPDAEMRRTERQEED